ncbi:hypothetical protein G647_04981 [Cladophialophora carrionii CBS 160.54]|uniref:Uncharacterized protein n=1 Tax=Cladophialophora carrionii CBS 160.54 TaxID=1279043 RepID=V9D8D6_9EURO|nr:uncharacterized protein G647_04981 [Cladophialophora carrionii CBS 160.54]ETI23184.1 hypothetical protein G647_04981 [Cladophialophora carrionii CBS 160.54]
MPVFGNFPGPEASSVNSSPESFTSEPAVGASVASPVLGGATTVLASSSALSLPSETSFNALLPETRPSQTDAEHGPRLTSREPETVLSHSHDSKSLHHIDDKPVDKDNENNDLQDIAVCPEQSAACSLIQTDTSNGRPPAQSFVPILSDFPEQLLVQAQRQTWLDQTVGFGTQDSLTDFPKENINSDPARPYPAALPRRGSTLATPPIHAFHRGPQRQTCNMCQDYKSGMRCGLPIQSCSPTTPSPLSSTFSLKSMPATTPASSTSSFKSLLSATNYAAVKMCDAERDYDNMYQHPLPPQYVDAMTLTALPPPRQRQRQHQLGIEPLPLPLYGDLIIERGTHVNANVDVNTIAQAKHNAHASLNDTAETNDMKIMKIADEHDVNSVIQVAIDTAIADDNAWDEITAAMPTAVEDLSVASVAGQDAAPIADSTSTSSSGHHVSLASVFAPTPTLTTACALTCTPASPCAVYPHSRDFECRSIPRSVELHNVALEALVRESEPLTWEEVREHERQRGTAVGEAVLVLSQVPAGRRVSIAP